jgi:hypothetical protein
LAELLMFAFCLGRCLGWVIAPGIQVTLAQCKQTFGARLRNHHHPFHRMTRFGFPPTDIAFLSPTQHISLTF